MTDKAAEILERLTPTHLQEENDFSMDDLKQTVELGVGTEEVEEKAKTNDPRMQKKFTFNINWKDPRGKVWAGEFVNRILSIRDRQLVGIMRARLSNGLPAESLDPVTREINLMISHLAFSLEEKPGWAEDFREMEYLALLQTIYMEVMAHEATFFGRGPID